VDGGAVAQMIKEINGDVERTKDMIEKIISKPKMTANLLSKPPFRFLHDTVTAITKATGFAEGLYNAEELDSQNIKEKQPKIDYLNKIIQCVSVHLNIEVDAKPAKIVAGLEPDDTNKFLQLLAIACRTGDSKSSVERVLSGDVALRVTPTGSESKHSTPKVSSTKQSPAMEPEAKLSSRSSTPSESKKNPTKEAKGSDDGSTRPSSSVGPLKALSVRGNEDEEENTNLRQESKDGGDLERGHGSNTSSGTSRTSRPTTARRRPPKIKENVKEAGRLLAVADNKLVPTVGIMRDGDNAESDDDNETPEGPSLGGGGNNSTITSEDGASHSKLVRNILKDQKAEEEAARKQKEEEEQKETTGEDTGIRLGKKRKSHRDKNKNGASSVAEFNEIRENIQKICQASNPVGKLIEFVHEDLDQMTKELDKWKKEYEKKCEVYEEEKKKTEEALQPLQVQLIEVEEQIKEQVHKINTLKATIAKNEEKTQKLLRMVVSA
jgi:TRAF3-interacting protein 1